MSSDEEPDERLVLVLDAGLRNLSQQTAAIDELRGRISGVLAAVSLSTAFLGDRALDQTKGYPAWAIVGLTAFCVVVIACLVVLWPVKWLAASLNARTLLNDYVDSKPPYTIDSMRRKVAEDAQDGFAKNEKKLKWRYWAFALSCFALGVDIAAWLLLLAGR